MSLLRKKTVSMALAVTLVMTNFNGIASVFADENNVSQVNLNKIMEYDCQYSEDDLESIEGEVFNPSKMSEVEKDAYYKVIDKQVQLAAQKEGANFNADKFREELIFVLETENSLQLLSDEKCDTKGSYRLVRSAKKKPKVNITVSNSVAAAAFNTAIDMLLISTGVGSVTLYIRKVGLKEAKRIFTKTVTSKLKAWGCAALATSIPAAVSFAFNLANPGQGIANYVAKHDSNPKSEDIELIIY